jgi:hypothetical protein
VPALVLEIVRCVRRNVDRFTSSNDALFSSEGNLDFALEDREHLLEIVAMRQRARSRWNVDVDKIVAARSVFAGH